MMAWARSRSLSLNKMRVMCVFTVVSLSWSLAASSALLSPLASSRRTSSSRGVSVERSRCRVAVCSSWGGCEALDEAAGDGGGEQRVAGADHTHGGDQAFGGDVFEEEAARSRGECGVHVLVEVEGRQDDDGRRGPGGGQDLPGGFQAIDLGHPDVHEHHVGAGFADCVDGLPAVGGFGDDLDPVGRQDHGEAGAQQCLVVGDYHPRRLVHVSSIGITACTRYPPVAILPASRVPP